MDICVFFSVLHIGLSLQYFKKKKKKEWTAIAMAKECLIALHAQETMESQEH